MLSLDGLEVSFTDRNGSRLPAVRDLSLTIAPGEAVGLVGESGSGKSVTSLAIMRLLPPQASIAGAIRFGGHDLLKLPEDEMRGIRGAKIAMIFQEPMSALNPVMRVGDQVAEAVRAHSAVSKKHAYARALEALVEVALPEPERRARDYPHQLSGGMRQRVMIAMAIVNHPQLLIADEPTTALDVTIQAQILQLLAEMRTKFNLALLLISHDLAVVSQVVQRVAVMYAGSMVETGPVSEIFSNPIHPYTRGLLKAVPSLRSDKSRPLATIEGSVPAIQSLPAGCCFEPRCGERIAACAHELPPLIEVTPGHSARCPVITGQLGSQLR